MIRQRVLNQSQLAMLHILYRFRFGTRSLLADYLNKPNNTSLYSRISILEKHEFLAVRYDKSYKLAGREAEYYVTPKGVRALGDAGLIELTDAGLRATYKDKVVSEQYVQQLTLLLRLRNVLCAAYPDLQYFTTRDVQALDYFPKKKPVAFLSLKQENKTKRFFVEYVPAQTSTSMIKSQLRQYTSYYDQDSWSVTNTPFPTVLYICEDGMTEQGVRWHIKRELYRTDTDLRYLTTTKKALLSVNQTNDMIWTDIDEPDELLSLS